jgi:F0F1-type ATP synthase alpha subunit
MKEGKEKKMKYKFEMSLMIIAVIAAIVAGIIATNVISCINGTIFKSR